MYLRGRTVALIVIFSVLFSSLATATFVGENGLSSLLFGSGNTSASRSGADGLEKYEDKLKQAYSLITTRYIDKVDDKKLMDGAIRGMVEALDDPYSSYMDEKAAKEFNETFDTSFQGIGAEVTMRNGRVTIVAPIKGSPAEKAGLRPEDQVIKVNGKSLEGMSLHEAVEKIRGPKGTKVKLEIMRPGRSDLLDVSVVRDEIPIETVHATMLDDKIGWIAITQFSTNTADDFAAALKKFEREGMKGLVIDVRGNPGGMLPSVREISENLLPKNRSIMQMEDSEKKVNLTAKLDKRKPYPITVLIDQGSASASEILAAAMKESGGYPLVGQKTFGKGTVQSAEEFKDGSNIKLTIAKWLTPNGNWIHNKGIKPDVEAKYPEMYNATVPQVEKPLKQNIATPDVQQVQLALKALGYRPDRTDGYFSEQTETAVKAFQKKHKLSMTGEVDQITAAKLQEELIKTRDDPKNDVQLRVAVEVLKKNIK